VFRTEIVEKKKTNKHFIIIAQDKGAKQVKGAGLLC
jgi:hypothetical protein